MSSEAFDRQDGSLRRAESHEGFPNPPERYPNLSERNPSRAEQIPNPAERNPNSKSLNFLSRIEPYQRVAPTPRHFAPLPALKAPRQRRRCSFASGCLSVLRSSFLRSIRSLEASEGLAPFLRSRMLGRRSSNSAAAEPDAPRATGGTLASTDPRVMSPGTEDRGRDRAIDPTSGRNASA